MIKNRLYQWRLCAIILCMFSIMQCMSGCIAAEALVGAEFGIGAGDVVVMEDAIGTTEGVTVVETAFTRTAAGDVGIANSEAVNSLLGKVKLEKAYGEPPKLYVEGKSEPIAEVYAKSGRIKILRTNRFYKIPENIFAVEGESVTVKSSRTFPNDIIATVQQGDLIVKLAEEDGWYHIKLIQNSRIYYGWIDASYAVPLITGAADNKKQYNKYGFVISNKPRITRKDYQVFVNQPTIKNDVSVLIIDENAKNLTIESNAIADVYTQAGKRAGVGLIRDPFLLYPEFQDLFDGNSTVIEKLKLNHYTDYLAMGRIVYSFRSGTLVKGTVICTASIVMNLISVKDKMLYRSFTTPDANGNGVTKAQAQEQAFHRLLDHYFIENTSL
jgi:hypothetical protein